MITFLYVLFTVLYTVFSLASFGLLIPTLDILFGTLKTEAIQPPPNFTLNREFLAAWFNYFINHKIITIGPSQTLLWVCAFILGSSILKNIFAYLNARLMLVVRSRVIYNLRQALFNRLLSFDLSYFANRQKGDLISRIANDVQEIELMLIGSLTIIFRDPLITIGYFIVMFAMSFKLTLFTLILIPVSGLFIGRISKQLRRDSVDIQATLGALISVLEETLGGFKIIKAFTAENFLRRRFEKLNSRYVRYLKRIFYKRDLASPLSEVFGIAVVTVILVYGGNLILAKNHELSASEFIAYLAIFSQILVPIKSMANSLTSIQKGLASADRILPILAEEPKIIDSSDAKSIAAFKDKISFKNISLRYDANDWTLQNISFEIKKGETVALVGRSGGGKTTLVNLLMRFIEAQKGKVLIDGQNLTDFKIESLRKLMGMVSQEAILFNDTIFNNITFGLDVSEAAVVQAAQIANAHEFITQLPNGYQTQIGDSGMKLSGGQRQRLTIARAILKDPAILILDEATSALDSQSEKLVQAALNNLLQNRTSIVIAHRLSTIRHADKILVIEKGKIVQSGTHEELIAEGGIYKMLLELQGSS